MRARCPALLLVLALAPGGCSETVGFVTLELVAPERSPALVCAGDPRRAAELRLEAECGGETHEKTVEVDGTGFSMGLPLGDCVVTVDAANSHGRAVLSGSADVTVGRGDNDPVQLQLVENRCPTGSCDGDGDGVADVDEQGLGIDASAVDTDGDGLEDGLELMQCCTDPSLPEGQCRELFIQRVEPPLGPVGTAVMVKASSQLDSPQVDVGGQPLGNLLADSTIAFGTVGQGAKLGEVKLTSGGGTVRHSELFAVLHDQPQSVAEIANRATGVGPVVYQLVDQAFDGARQWLLGRASASSAGATLPVLILLDRQKQASFRALVALKGEPVALSAAAGRVLVVLDVDGEAVLVLYTPPTDVPGLGLPQELAFGAGLALDKPLELVLEPSGDTAQLLLAKSLLRFRFDAGGKVVAARSLSLDKSLGPVGSAGCTGLAFHDAPGKAATYLACNATIPCPAGTDCVPQGLMARVDIGCLDLGSSTTPGPGCASLHLFGGRQPALGNPVIDPVAGRVYLLGGLGVMAADMDGTPKLILPLVPMQWSAGTAAADRMALVPPHLFVADGPHVWRMEPGAKDPSVRRGKPFLVSRGTDEAHSLAVSPDGTALSVGVQVSGGFSWLMGVCLEACQP